MARSHWLGKHGRMAFSWGLLITAIGLAPALAAPQFPSNLQNDGTTVSHPGGHKTITSIPDDSITNRNEGTPPLSTKQKQFIVHANFEKSKSDAAELAALAKALREELNKPNANGLSLEAAARIDRIQKLAKKIRDETKGY